ncbi:MAG TPA: outer membrane protein assembly factor BamD [Anaeromyxobacter sp.]
MRRRLLAASVLLALAACSKHLTLGGEAKILPTAEENYQAGQELLKDGSYPEATKFFEYVKTKFPFSKFAALAELRLGDVKFADGKFAEAADAYAQWVQLHPAHDELDYAELRVGESYLKDAPSEFFMFPPAYEKDLRQVRKAADALKKFVDKYPDSKRTPDAKKLLESAQTRLSSYEWYVAEFYFKRQRWAGAAGRYETLVEKYPGSKHEVDALLKLAQSAVELKEPYRARTALQRLIVQHPQDPRRAEAEKLLAALR